MKLLERYVSAVKSYLPAAARDDVGAELYGLLEEQFDAESEKLGRPLTEEEIASLLKRHGHPYKTAAAYSPAKALVGANAYALYKRTMSKLLSVWFVVIMLIGAYDLFNRETAWAIFGVPGFWHMTVDVLLALFFVVTLIFHLWGDILDRSGLGWIWNPARLPDTQGTWIRVSKFGVIAGTVILMSFLGLITTSSHEYQTAEASFAIAKPVVALIPALQGIVLLMLTLNAANLLQSHWTRIKLFVSASLSITMAGLLAFILAFHRVLLLSEQGADATALGNSFLSIWPEVVLKVVMAIAVVLLSRAAWRSLRLARTPGLPGL